MATLTRRERLRADTIAEIKDAARHQIATHGPASLSIRGIARDIGMSPAELYRHYDSLDTLITELVTDTYTDLADTVETAVAGTGTAGERLRAGMHAYRAWATADPQRFLLSSWAAVSQSLNQAGYRTLAPDQRGYSPGARPPRRGDYTDRQLVDDVWALLDAAGLEQAHVVGHDWGGVVAWWAASDRPDRVRTLSVFSVPHPAAVLAAVRRGQAWRSWYLLVFLVPGLAERLLEPGSGRWDWLMQGLPAERVRHYGERMAQPGAFTAALNWYRAMPTYARKPGVKAVSITPPTLFAWGSKDPTTTPAAAEGSGDYLSGPYTYRVLDGATHWLPEIRTAEVADLLLAHLSGPYPAASNEADT